MKTLFFLIGLLFFSIACHPNQEVVRPLLDFTNQKDYEPFEIRSYSFNADCPTIPYWEAKKLKLKGFVSETNISSKDLHFSLYTTANLKTDAITIHFGEAIESSKILDLALKNKNKYCSLTVTCGTEEVFTHKCVRILKLNLLKIEDIEYK